MNNDFVNWAEIVLKAKYDEGYTSGYKNGFVAAGVVVGLGYAWYRWFKWVKTPIVDD